MPSLLIITRNVEFTHGTEVNGLPYLINTSVLAVIWISWVARISARTPDWQIRREKNNNKKKKKKKKPTWAAGNSFVTVKTHIL